MQLEPRGRQPRSRSHDWRSAVAGVIASVLYAVVESQVRILIPWLGAQFGLAAAVVCTAGIGFVVFSVSQFCHWWWDSGSLWLTLYHYRGVLWDALLQGWIVYMAVLIHFACLGAMWIFFTAWPTPGLRPLAIFFVTGPCLGLALWLGLSRYRSLASQRGKGVLEVIVSSQTSGLLKMKQGENKDGQVRTFLYGIRDADFIFLWAIHFSQIIGRGNPNSSRQLSDLVKNNPAATLHACLQWPFSKDVIDRSVELGATYDENYVTDTAYSLATCLATGGIAVTLRYGKPLYRMIVWGRFKTPKPKAAGAYDTQLAPEDFLRTIEDGAFVLQEYPRGVHGSDAELVQGSVITHGCIWERLRAKFLSEVQGGVSVGEDGEPQGSDETLFRIARLLDASRAKNVVSRQQAIRFIAELDQYANLMRLMRSAKAGLASEVPKAV